MTVVGKLSDITSRMKRITVDIDKGNLSKGMFTLGGIHEELVNIMLDLLAKSQKEEKESKMTVSERMYGQYREQD